MPALKEPIAKRTLMAGDTVVVVTINKPEEDEGDFRCRYSLEVGHKVKLSYAMGMDSVQALQLVMRKIDADLLEIGKGLGVPVTWLEDRPGDTGFVA